MVVRTLYHHLVAVMVLQTQQEHVLQDYWQWRTGDAAPGIQPAEC